jgi:hypothetical protein
VFDLASLHALKEISRLLINSKLFEMMFELNDFKNFKIKRVSDGFKYPTFVFNVKDY